MAMSELRQARTITTSDVRTDGGGLLGPGKTHLYVKSTTVRCPNPDCKSVKLVVQLFKGVWQQHNGRAVEGDFIQEWTLIPASGAKAFPNYIPRQILGDYQEACLIQQGSPRASAAMSRRCLQGMIRDFWKVHKKTLKLEIDAIQDRVDADVWEAIESVRKIGNIGAHMERDVDLIIDVEPEEAGLLIWLIEYLLDEWYVERHQRQEKLRELKALPAAKEAIKALPAPEAPTEPVPPETQ
jgi:hypothetical protein